MNDIELVKKFRCLRLNLSPLITTENKQLLEAVEDRLKNPGNVFTPPAPTSEKKKRKGKRRTSTEIFNELFYK